jgi:hypothetical protein
VYQPAIFTYGGVDTDHKLVVVDLSIDCAGGAAQQVQLWNKHKKESWRWDADDVGVMADEKTADFNEKARALTAGRTPGTAEELHEWLKEAATGTVMKRVLQEFPKKARDPKNFQSEDWKIRTSLSKMRETVRNLEETLSPTNRKLKKAQQPLKRVRHLDDKDTSTPVHEACRGKAKEETLQFLRGRIEEFTRYLARSARVQRQESITANKKRRTTRFQHNMKKKLKNVITSIMRRASVHEEITTCLSEDGKSIRTSDVEVAEEVVKFYKNWMKSKVH